MVSAVFITFKKSFDPHKLRLHLTPKAFFSDAFQKLPSGNTGPTHTVTHTTNCAERTAFFKAVSEGVRDFQAICIVGGKDGVPTEYAAPCGVCRQVMMEFCDPETFQIILAVSREKYDIFTLKELLPFGFGPDNLKKLK